VLGGSPGALGQRGIARQKVSVIDHVREGEDRLHPAADPRVALAAQLILLIERQILQAVNGPGFVAIRIELRPGRFLLLGDLDVLAAGTVTALTADRELTVTLHRPVLARRWRVRRYKFEAGRVTSHAFRFREASDR